MENFVLFRQAVYNSYYKFLICIGAIIALVWVEAYTIGREKLSTCAQKVTELANSEPREHQMGYRSLDGDRWEDNIKSAKEDLEDVKDGYITIRYLTAFFLGLFGLISGICTQLILCSESKEHELYCKAKNFPFLTALCYWLVRKQVNFALW